MKLFLRKLIKYLLIPFGIIYNCFAGKEFEILILMYHRVNDGVHKEMAVKSGDFAWQMDYLHRKDYKIISMDEAAHMVENGGIKGKYIVLTFDDGYMDFYINAYPILKKYRFPSTVYLVPNFIETDKTFWWDTDKGESPLMNWYEIHQLSKAGIVDFGSHTMNHWEMNNVEGNGARYEIEESRKVIEEMTGREVKHFSYPGGFYNEDAERIIKGVYKTGVLIFKGKSIRPGFNMDSITKLKRLPVQQSDGKYLFAARINGWLIAEELIRKIMGCPY
jgi:Predicted xylanase/chitin deacetylase